MGSKGTSQGPGNDESKGLPSPETTIEIKIKTLDSQTYTLKVDKQMPVPALKEQIASVTGVLSEQQRLICCGRVLKDDQLLSAYHVEDGHTLHLVVRQPPSDSLPSNSASDPASSASHGRTVQLAPGVVLETISMPGQGEAMPPEINQILAALFGAFASSFGTTNNPEVIDLTGEGGEQRSAFTRVSSAAQPQSDPTGITPASSFGLPLPVSFPPVIPDSLITLSQYLTQMRQEFTDIVTGRGRNTNAQADTQGDNNSQSGSRDRLPRPESLAEVMLSSRQLLTEQVAACLLQLARQLQSHANMTDSAARLSMQSNAWRTGIQLHNLGAYLLELGRSITAVRLGQEPSGAIVGAGPAVFINPAGPNPLMVQPLQLQRGTFGGTFGGSVSSGPNLVSGIGSGFLPRRIDIQIRRGSRTTAANANREENSENQQQSGQRTSATATAGESLANQTTSSVTEGSLFPGDSGVRVVPIRTMVATIPGLSSLPTNLTGELRLDSSLQRQNAEYPVRDGSPTINSSQREAPRRRNVQVHFQPATGSQNIGESDRQLPENIMEALRAMLPEDVEVEDAGLLGEATVEGGSTEDADADADADEDADADAEPAVTDDATILANLIRDMLPYLAQQNTLSQRGAQNSENETASTQAENSNAGTSSRHMDADPGSPSSKRQRRE